jgi:F-type H+-transporting ATPase subunit b
MTEHAAPATIRDLGWPTLNFVLFVAVLVYYLRGPVVEYFRARTARLRQALAAGASARSEAESLRATLARELEALPALRARLRADLRATAERERETILTIARQAAERIRNDAKLVATHELEAGRDALRAEVIDEAVRQASALIQAALRADDHQRLVREFVREATVS